MRATAPTYLLAAAALLPACCLAAAFVLGGVDTAGHAARLGSAVATESPADSQWG